MWLLRVITYQLLKKTNNYWVQILAKNSFIQLWKGIISKKEYSHTRVYKISGDQFYALLTGQEDALLQLYKALPRAIKDYRNSIEQNKTIKENSAIDEIKSETENSRRSILDQITFENYSYYLGFDKL